MYFFLSFLTDIQGRDYNLGDFVGIKGLLFSIIISFKFAVVIDIAESYIMFLFHWPGPSFKVRVVLESKDWTAYFLAKLSIDLDDVKYDEVTCGYG